MTKVPSLPYDRIIKALQRDGWIIVRKRGSHIRLQKHIGDELLKITIPAHHPLKRLTLAHILKPARIDNEGFLELLQQGEISKQPTEGLPSAEGQPPLDNRETLALTTNLSTAPKRYL